MKKLAWLLALSLPLAACVVGEDGTGGDPGGGGDDDQGSGSGSGSGSQTSPNSITENTTWSGTFNLTANMTIEAGVTVTVEPGTVITAGPNGALNVKGTFDAQGTKAAPITIQAATAGASYGGISIATGGLANLTYVVQTGGGVHLNGGKAVIVDTYMSQAAGGDFLTMAGGELDMSYSQVGRNVGETDSTHCDMHFGGPMPNTIKVTNSNISTTSYGLMFYGGTNANFTNNNWFGNSIDVATQPGVQGDFTGSWFEDTPPQATGNGGAQLVVTGLSATRLTAGPR